MNHNTTALVSSTGKVTLPASIRKALRLGKQSRVVRFELCEDGSAKIYLIIDALDLKGVFADPSRPYDPKERAKAWAVVARDEARKGRR
jgi:bifunctional DNA-binding transcriptional regulator/antitoxin component of YhaV-PrlF toxin-antitoxin module